MVLILYVFKIGSYYRACRVRLCDLLYCVFRWCFLLGIWFVGSAVLWLSCKLIDFWQGFFKGFGVGFFDGLVFLSIDKR